MGNKVQAWKLASATNECRCLAEHQSSLPRQRKTQVSNTQGAGWAPIENLCGSEEKVPAC